MVEGIYHVQQLRYEDRVDELTAEIQLNPDETNLKSLPIFLGKNNQRLIFKPLSKTKPFCNDLYAIAEVYCSRVIEHYFNPQTPLYHLAVCEGVSEALPNKFDKGNLVEMFTQPGQRFMSFAEYFQQDENSELHDLVKNFTNYCLMWYDFTPFFENKIFKDNSLFSDKLASLVLYSMLFENSNFHYGNAGFIVDRGNQIVDVAPSYDNEFSFIFNSLDNPNQQAVNFASFYAYTGNNRLVNLSYLVEHKESLVCDFLDKVVTMTSDRDRLRHFSDVSNIDGFIGNCDSEMWEVHKLKKDGKNIKAITLEEKLNKSRSEIEINLSDISTHIYENQLRILHRILSNFGII